MSLRVAVWGTGNAGRPAIRAVAAHQDLELAGLIVSNPAKVGVDAGALAFVEPLGVTATDDADAVLASGIDALVYTATGDTRPDDATTDLLRCLRAGANVVSTAFYSLLHPPTTPAPLRAAIDDACATTGASVFVSGIDPGWALDILPALVSGVGAGITEIRVMELFDYSLYDQPEIVRTVIGFGGSMDELPLMLWDVSLEYVWGPMVRVLADALGLTIDRISTHVERRPLEQPIDVPGMGEFLAGTQGAFRFEVRGQVGGAVPIVVEHVTRITGATAPDWPQPAFPGGEHRVQLTGHPNLTVAVHGTEPGEPGAAGGGNASAANRIVNAIPAVCAAPAGIVGPFDLPPITGARQLRLG